MQLYTIGFAKKTAQDFFLLLQTHRIQRLIDTRLNNTSQLAGFTKKEDLQYFLGKISDIDYLHYLELAPTKTLLKAYKQNHDWSLYRQRFLALLETRQIEHHFSPEIFAESCLLCSEPLATYCHRRLVAEYLQEKWEDIQIIHL